MHSLLSAQPQINLFSAELRYEGRAGIQTSAAVERWMSRAECRARQHAVLFWSQGHWR